MLRPNQQRSERAVTMIWFVLVFQIIFTIFNSIDTIYIRNNPDEELDVLGFIYVMGWLTVIIAYVTIWIISIVTFIKWFRRAYSNLHQKVGSLSYSEGWATGAWFIPIMNFFAPYTIMKELYSRTDNLFRLHNIPSTLQSDLSYVSWWWVLWIVIRILNYISLRLYLLGDYQYMLSTWIEIIGCILTVPLCMVTEKVIKNYSKAEFVLMDLDKEPSFISDEGETVLKSY